MSDSTTESLGLRERSKLATRKRIQSAAEALMTERDLAEITTKEIANKAEIGEATLFRYIGSKDDLLIMIYGDQMDRLIGELEAQDEQLATGTLSGELVCERILAFYEGRAEFYLQNPTNASRYLRYALEMTGPNTERTLAQGDRIISRVTDILVEGQAHGYIVSGVDPFIVAQNCHGIFIHEVDRTPTRGFDPATLWERVSARINAQIRVLIRPEPPEFAVHR